MVYTHGTYDFVICFQMLQNQLPFAESVSFHILGAIQLHESCEILQTNQKWAGDRFSRNSAADEAPGHVYVYVHSHT